MSDPILEIRGLRLTIRTDEGMAKVLDHIDFALERGRILGIVGESGCGKSTIIRAIIGILPPGAKVEAGVICFDGKDLLGLSEGELNRRIRGSRISHPDPNGAVALDDRIAPNPRRCRDLAVPVGIVNAGTAAVEAQAVIRALHYSFRQLTE